MVLTSAPISSGQDFDLDDGFCEELEDDFEEAEERLDASRLSPSAETLTAPRIEVKSKFLEHQETLI